MIMTSHQTQDYSSTSDLPDIHAFISCPWREAIADEEIKICDYYYIPFAKKANELADGDQRNALKILSDVCTLSLFMEHASTSYKPIFEATSGRSFSLEDVTDQMAEIFWEFLQTVDDTDLKARLADIIWIHRGPHKREAARIAVQALLESSYKLRKIDKYRSVARLSRAVTLSFELGRGGHEEQGATFDVVREWIRSIIPEDADGLDALLIEILIKYWGDHLGEWIPICENIADAKKAQGKYHLFRIFQELIIQLLNTGECSQDEIREIHKKIIDSYIAEASIAEVSALQRSRFLEMALGACRKYGLTDEYSSLHKDLISAQKNILPEMQSFEIPIPSLDKCRKKAIDSVSGKEFYQALFDFSHLLPIISKARLIESAREYIKKHPLAYLFSGSVIDQEGKTVRKFPSLDLASFDEDNALLLRAIIDILRTEIIISTLGFIRPALEILIYEHNFCDYKIIPMLRNHLFIPPDHEIFYLRGLVAGYRGDYAAACSYLIPQIENSLRYLLSQQCQVTSSFTSSGEQPEKPLEFLLNHPFINDALGEDLVFLLRLLLIEKGGLNLRNRFAHGLMQYQELQSVECQYFWWLIQRIIVLPFLANLREQENGI